MSAKSQLTVLFDGYDDSDSNKMSEQLHQDQYITRLFELSQVLRFIVNKSSFLGTAQNKNQWTIIMYIIPENNNIAVKLSYGIHVN